MILTPVFYGPLERFWVDSPVFLMSSVVTAAEGGVKVPTPRCPLLNYYFTTTESYLLRFATLKRLNYISSMLTHR